MEGLEANINRLDTRHVIDPVKLKLPIPWIEEGRQLPCHQNDFLDFSNLAGLPTEAPDLRKGCALSTHWSNPDSRINDAARSTCPTVSYL